MALILSGDTGVPASGMPTGSVIQTVQFTTTTQTLVNTGNTDTNTNLTYSITPQFSSSKILINIHLPFVINTSGTYGYCGFGVKRNSTVIYTPPNDSTGSFAYGVSGGNSASTQNDSAFSFQLLDSPATTSATTYTVYVNLYPVSGAQVRVPYNNGGASAETAILILQEIKG